DCGDFWPVAGRVLVDVEGEQPAEKGPVTHKKGALVLLGVSRRIIKAADYEKPTGEWNTIELLTVGGTSVHVVNGKPNLVLRNTRRGVDGKEEPLVRGKIQLQSEGAEVFYRNIAVRPLKKIPDEFLK